MILVTIRATLRGSEREAVLAAAAELQAATQAEPGCREYRFWVAADDPAELLLFERWEDQASLDAHLRTPGVERFRPVLVAGAHAGTIEVTRFAVSDAGPLVV